MIPVVLDKELIIKVNSKVKKDNKVSNNKL